MGSTKALLLAGAVALGAATAAHAADLPLAPSLPTYVPEPAAFAGWYIRGDAGAGLAFSPDIRSSFYDDSGSLLTGDAFDSAVHGFGRSKQGIGDVGFVDLGVGYTFNSWLRFDVTGEVRSDAHIYTDEFYDAGYYYGAPGQYYAHDIYKGAVQSSVFLVNGYADLGTWWGLTPFIGGGVGAVYNHLGNMVDTNTGVDVVAGNVLYSGVGAGGAGFAVAKSKWNLAYAGMVGVSYNLTSNLKLELGYRYLDMGNITTGVYNCNGSCTHETQKLHLASNDIRIGLRWLITDDVPAPAFETPIIRKD